MNEFDFQDLGRQISDAVSDALHSKEFTELKTTIKTTVQDAAQSVQTSFHTPIFQQRPRQPMTQAQPTQVSAPYVRRPMSYGPRFKIPGNVASVLLLVFGFIGLGAVLLGVLVSGIASLLSHTMGLFSGLSLGVFLPLLAVFLIMIFCGFALQGRVKRFKA